MKKDSEAQKFSSILRRSGLSGKDFGASLGLTAAQVSNIVNARRKPSRDVLVRLQEVYNVDLNWYLSGDSGEAGRTTESVNVPYFDQEAAAGRGIEINDWAERRALAVPSFLIRPHNRGDVAAITISGDSMTGEKIRDGDVALFTIRVKTGNGIFVLSVGSALLCKRVAFDEVSRSITLISANPAYPPRVISGEELETVKIEGRVIAVLHREV
jgi:SOS-response transcriptional repressor LexA